MERKTRVFVTGLPFTTDRHFLHNLFSETGLVVAVTLDTEKNHFGGKRLTATIDYETPDGARRAIDELNGLMLDGRAISVIYADKATKSLAKENRNKVLFKNLPEGTTDLDLRGLVVDNLNLEVIQSKIKKGV